MIELILLDGATVVAPLTNPGSILSPEELCRYEKLRSDSRRREFLLGRMLLKSAFMGDACQADDFSRISTTILATGKPSLPGIEFNLSHDGDAVLLAIGDQAVGVDIESVQYFDGAMMAACFTGDECRRVSRSRHPDRAATLLWSMKEAAAKATGAGLLSEIGAAINPDLFFRCGFLKTGGCHRAYAVCSTRPVAPVKITPALPRFDQVFTTCQPGQKSRPGIDGTIFAPPTAVATRRCPPQDTARR